MIYIKASMFATSDCLRLALSQKFQIFLAYEFFDRFKWKWRSPETINVELWESQTPQSQCSIQLSNLIEIFCVDLEMKNVERNHLPQLTIHN
jgi:hypothetical protein